MIEFWFWIRILSLEALEGLGFLFYGVCGNAVVWVMGGYVSIGGGGFAVEVVDGGWSQSHKEVQIFFSC